MLLLRQRADGFLTAGSRAVGKVPAEFDPAQDNGRGHKTRPDVPARHTALQPVQTVCSLYPGRCTGYIVVAVGVGGRFYDNQV